MIPGTSQMVWLSVDRSVQLHEEMEGNGTIEGGITLGSERR